MSKSAFEELLGPLQHVIDIDQKARARRNIPSFEQVMMHFTVFEFVVVRVLMVFGFMYYPVVTTATVISTIISDLFYSFLFVNLVCDD